MGGVPAVTPDIPVSAVLLALFALGAITHITLFRLSLRRGRKFIFSLLLMGFCFTRIAALSLRIVWARNPTNANIALAANILVAAGVIILFIVNLIFTSCFVVVWWSVVACTCSMFTLDMDARQKERKVTLFACGVNFAAKPIGVVEWYHSRAAFYCFNFMIEIIVVYVYLVEQRFYVPKGTSKPGDYSRLQEQEGELQEVKEATDGSGASTDRGGRTCRLVQTMTTAQAAL
ncbi:hypothetical protein NEMBOFW57_009127 [Staphylotrichum longicolle]|uniref:Uncharacterized protein n=1 Tax=Staphylotrichum longicolle TaxID=669026 RepID=A0AAD4ET06_9PEZI|nr:hypothetical protein NEMBOFW57_009127 [Staphylotrichum longicolle]